MKRAKLWMMAAILLCCGTSVLTSCNDYDDNTASQSSDIWDAKTGTLIVNSNPGKNAYKGRTDIKKLIISNDVTSIGDSAFFNCDISVIDLPASVVRIGSEAFSGDDAPLQMITINAKDCDWGTHPFFESILVNIYVPAEAVAKYETKYPNYKKQLRPIPEAVRTGNVIEWDGTLCDYTWDTILYAEDGKNVTAHNSQGGITVTFNGTEEDSGFGIWGIHLIKGEKLTFTSMVGEISQIKIQVDPYVSEFEDEPGIPVAEGWTWNNEKNTFTWQGTPSETVEMIASDDIDMDKIEISFTLDN